ncbi:MAG: hypothetical protein EBW55_06430 [Betaproteobacteria bacterium]|nr:hypothetical protein [Betaproteobacteria bacterium]
MNTMMGFTTNPPKRAVSNFHRAYGFGIRWSKQVDFDPGVLLTDLEAEDLADESLALIEDLSKMAANHFQSSIGYTLYEPLATPSLAAGSSSATLQFIAKSSKRRFVSSLICTTRS